MDAARAQEERFYSRFGCIYSAFRAFYHAANGACFGGRLPECTLHLSKLVDGSRTVAWAIRDFGHDGEKPVPAIAIRLWNCRKGLNSAISPRVLAVEVLREMIRLSREIAGEPAPLGFSEDFAALGFNEAARSYKRDTPFAMVMSAADEHLSPVMGRLLPALMDEFSATAKADIRYYLAGRL